MQGSVLTIQTDRQRDTTKTEDAPRARWRARRRRKEYAVETARDRILKALRHEASEITPFNISNLYGSDRWMEHFGATDGLDLRGKLGVDVQYARPVYTGKYAEQNLSMFGTPVEGVFGADGVGYGEDRGGYPLADVQSVRDVEAFDWPSPDDFDYEAAATVLESLPDDVAKRVDGKYGIARPGKPPHQCQSGPWLPLLCTLFDLYGLDNACLKLAMEPEIMKATIARYEAFMLEFIRRTCEATAGKAEFFFLGDDFATQNGLFISPDDWRRFLGPAFKKMFAMVKSYDMKVWFHSCGQFTPVLPDLIDYGMDVWETVQVHLEGNDPAWLKREFGRHITFHGAISTQHTLPYGTPEDVRAEVRERIRVLGEGGGYICAPDHGVMPDVPIENVEALVDEAKRFRP
jgi:uroporphyrinogen decarboxylase